MSCNCNCNSTPITIPTGADGAPGAPGVDGTNGSNGVFGGYSGKWLFNTSTGTGPNVTELRFNNVNPALATKVYINDTDANSVDLNTFMQTLIAFPNVGGVYSSYIRIFKEFDSSRFYSAKIIGIVDNGTNVEFTVDAASVMTNGVFANTDPVVATFSASGADGTAGAPGVGTDGTTVLYNDLTNPTASAAAYTAVSLYSIPANTLASNGDRVHVRFLAEGRLSGAIPGRLRIQVNNLFYTPASLFQYYPYNPGGLDKGQIQGIVDMWIERVSNTVLAVSSQYITIGAKGSADVSLAWTEQPAGVGVIDCTNNPIPIQFELYSDGSNALTANQCLVELHKI